jgi:hypothetical protein
MGDVVVGPGPGQLKIHIGSVPPSMLRGVLTDQFRGQDIGADVLTNLFGGSRNLKWTIVEYPRLPRQTHTYVAMDEVKLTPL